MTVMVTVELNVKPEKFDEARGIFKEALKATREWEGCHSVEVYSNKEASKYVFIEEFDSEAIWQEYFAWRIEESGAILGELLSAPPQPTFYKFENFGYGKDY